MAIDTTTHSSTTYTASASLSYDMLDDFDRRLATLVDDITSIEQRLGQMSDRMRS